MLVKFVCVILHPPCLLFEPPFSWVKCCRIASFGIKSFKIPMSKYIYIYIIVSPHIINQQRSCWVAAILKAKVLLLCWGPARHQGWPPTISWVTIAQWPDGEMWGCNRCNRCNHQKGGWNMMKPLKKKPVSIKIQWCFQGIGVSALDQLGGNVWFGGTFGLNIDSRVMVAISNIISWFQSHLQNDLPDRVGIPANSWWCPVVGGRSLSQDVGSAPTVFHWKS